MPPDLSLNEISRGLPRQQANKVDQPRVIAGRSEARDVVRSRSATPRWVLDVCRGISQRPAFLVPFHKHQPARGWHKYEGKSLCIIAG